MFPKLRPRFSLRMLLAAMLVLGVALGMFARINARARRQREIVAAAAAAGGYVRYDFECWSESPSYAAQRWLEPRTGPDLVGNVLILNFDDRATKSVWAKAVSGATALQTLEYLSATRPDLSPQHIEHLARFAAMKQLCLNDVQDLPDLKLLAELKQLDKLGLYACRGVTADKLQALRTLPRLKLIDLCLSDANDDVVRLLTEFPALEELHAQFSGITYNGLACLKESKSLRIVHVDFTQAATNLAAELPGIKVDVK